MVISSSRTSGIEFGGAVGNLWRGWESGMLEGVQSNIFQVCRRSTRSGFCEIQSFWLALSHVILFLRYIDAGPVSTISRSGVSWSMNQLYKGVELVTMRPSSTWMGMMRISDLPDDGMEMEGWGGEVQRPIKTEWSSSLRKSLRCIKSLRRKM